MSRREKSCGCVIINNEGKVLLVYETTANFWGFPKGHVEIGETEIETAKREVYEETGLDVDVLEKFRYVTKYKIFRSINKTAILFPARPKTNKVVIQESEIKDYKWCTKEEALSIMIHDNLKKILKKAYKDLNIE